MDCVTRGDISCKQGYFSLSFTTRYLSMELEVAVIRGMQHWTTFHLKEAPVIKQVVVEYLNQIDISIFCLSYY